MLTEGNMVIVIGHEAHFSPARFNRAGNMERPAGYFIRSHFLHMEKSLLFHVVGFPHTEVSETENEMKHAFRRVEENVPVGDEVLLDRDCGKNYTYAPPGSARLLEMKVVGAFLRYEPQEETRINARGDKLRHPAQLIPFLIGEKEVTVKDDGGVAINKRFNEPVRLVPAGDSATRMGKGESIVEAIKATWPVLRADYPIGTVVRASRKGANYVLSETLQECASA